jgi:integrase
MAIVRKIYDMLYIQWWDWLTKKTVTRTTGMTATTSNWKKAEAQAKQLQAELKQKRKALKRQGINKVTTIGDAFDLHILNNQNKHPKTIKDYERFRKRFTEKFHEDLPTTSINKLYTEQWLNEIKKSGYAKNTIHGYGKQLNHFLNFLFEYNLTPWFKINREVRTRPEIKEKIVFTDEDLTKIFTGLKDKKSNFITTIYLLFYTGLRSSDVLTITTERIDIKNRVINYYSPKRKKYREIAFHKDLLPILKKRVQEVPSGLIIDYSNIENLGRAIIRYIRDDLKLNKLYTARTFRKTFITLCRSRYNMNAAIVRELVGHEHGNTQDRYYNEISIDNMRVELLKFRRPKFKAAK